MLGTQIKRFINLIDEEFLKPKKEEFYDVQKSFNKCREVIQTFIHRKKLRRENFIQWLLIWFLLFLRNRDTFFSILKHNKKDLKFFIKEYWYLKGLLISTGKIIDKLDDIAEKSELLILDFEKLDKRFKTVLNKLEIELNEENR
jgi:hypothetical protein